MANGLPTPFLEVSPFIYYLTYLFTVLKCTLCEVCPFSLKSPVSIHKRRLSGMSGVPCFSVGRKKVAFFHAPPLVISCGYRKDSEKSCFILRPTYVGSTVYVCGLHGLHTWAGEPAIVGRSLLRFFLTKE